MAGKPEIKRLETDILIIGGGTAGCLAAVEAREKNPKLRVTILEKAHIDRSGCLASGMNAINAYLNPGETPESFVKYIRYDACGLIREDLVKTGGELLNETVSRVESWGLPVKKRPDGTPEPRGRWNIKINGESLKPIIAKAARQAGAEIINRVNVTSYLVQDGRVVGAVGFGVRDGQVYVVKAKAVIVSTGGAAGIYKPNNPGSAQHKMWYPPYNTGAGYAMGIRAGAEMTSFEMRFIALRTKDIICPTGTLALGFGAKQVNAKGEQFMSRRFSHVGGEGAPTCYRVYGPTVEVKEGRGPCAMDTRHLTPEQVRDLKANYLDMYPQIVLFWAANEFDPSKEPIEICGTEPYIMGGHCQAGYWVGTDRSTTLPGLFAAGDVSGGYPYKFVSGCWAEGVIAARSAVDFVAAGATPKAVDEKTLEESINREIDRVLAPARRWEEVRDGVTPVEMEERLHKVMDEYAGGVGTFYEMNDERLEFAMRKVRNLKTQIQYLVAGSHHETLSAHEIIDRVEVAEAVILHLLYRKETRWPGYQTRLDYPRRDDFKWLKFVNSKKNLETGDLEIVERPYQQIVPGDRYLPR